MDALAKPAMSRHTQPTTMIHEDEWQITLLTGKVSSSFKSSIQHYISSSQLEHKWSKPRKRRNQGKPPYLTSTRLQQLDLEATKSAWKQLKGGMKRFVAKLSSEQLPVGCYMYAIRQWKMDICPQCLTPNKTTTHVLCCNSDRTKEFLSDLLMKL